MRELSNSIRELSNSIRELSKIREFFNSIRALSICIQLESALIHLQFKTDVNELVRSFIVHI